MSKVVEWIFERAWAITQEALTTIIAIAEQGLTSEMSVREALKEQGISLDGIQTQLGTPLQGTQQSVIRDGAVIIPIVGPIFPRANLMTALSGAASSEIIARDMRIALESEQVDRIILSIDSPGGQITGVSELSRMIYDARGQKPISSYISGMGASAAYWIASAADEVIVADTAIVGSLGVVAPFTDTSKRDEQAGVKRYEFVSSVSPLKRPDINTDEGRGKLQRVVDAAGEILISSIARNRGTDEETVLEDFGKGDVFVGALAVAQGLADDVGSLEEMISGSTGLVVSSHSTGGRSMGKEQGTEVVMTVDILRAEHKAVYDAVFADGEKAGILKGAEGERERIQLIEAISAPGSEKIIAENKFKPEMTADKVSALILQDQEATRKSAADKLGKDGKELADKTKGVEQPTGQENEQESVAAAMVKGANEGR